MKKIGVLAGFFLAAALVVLPPKAEASTVSEKLQDAVTNLTTSIQTKIDEVQTLKESGEYVAERMDTAEEILMDTNTSLIQAEKDVMYLYVAGVQEKRVLRLAVISINSVVRARYEQVLAIDEQLGNSEITADEAEDLLQAQLELTEDEFTQYKNTFKENVQDFLKVKANTSRVYLDNSLTLATVAVDMYGDLGYDTARATELLAEAQTSYDDANALYQGAKDGDDEGDVENMQTAAITFVKARRTLTKVQIRIKAWEDNWTAAHPAE